MSLLAFSALQWVAAFFAFWFAFCFVGVVLLFAAGAYMRRADRRARERWPHAKGARR